MFGTSLNRERERDLDLDIWAGECPPIDGVSLAVPDAVGGKMIDWACGCRKRDRRSCGELVLVDESSEAVSAVHGRRAGGWSRDRVWEAFAAKGADETLRDRVCLRRPSRRADDPDVLALKDLVERGREFRVAVANRESDRRGAARPSVNAPMILRVCCVVHAPVGLAVMPATYVLRVASSMKTSTYRRRSSTVSTMRKSHAMIPDACARRNVRQLSDARRGAGSIPACVRIAHTVLAASVISRWVSSPWILR
jgi:hypothetical protein